MVPVERVKGEEVDKGKILYAHLPSQVTFWRSANVVRAAKRQAAAVGEFLQT